MIMENCSAHPDVDGLKAIELKRFSVNTTSNTQPMDQGIIRSLKAKYRHLRVRRIIRYLDSGKPLPTTSILDVMIMLVKAWNAVKEKTIVECSRKAGISPESQSSAVNDDDDPFKDIEIENDTQHDLDALVADDAKAQELVSVDAEVETSSPSPTEAEIVAEILGEGEEQDDGDEDEVVEVDDDPLLPPSTYSVGNAIETISKFRLFYEDDKLRRSIDDLSMQVNSVILKNKKQNTFDFFT